jgi:hypothetical protein
MFRPNVAKSGLICKLFTLSRAPYWYHLKSTAFIAGGMIMERSNVAETYIYFVHTYLFEADAGFWESAKYQFCNQIPFQRDLETGQTMAQIRNSNFLVYINFHHNEKGRWKATTYCGNCSELGITHTQRASQSTPHSKPYTTVWIYISYNIVHLKRVNILHSFKKRIDS